ncbi:hypothetical protein ACFFSH_31560 [Streptomyces filamentosus]|uniref:hypothetical protein n=1 Tax=Streptomyces filamentosus TaxID=67294 RepID=UPI001E3926AF|nr:hypothetical protein [Streptomyces filamentosus]
MHTRQEREAAARTWLLISARDAATARSDWKNYGVALLRCGALFSAVRIPAILVHAAAGTADRPAVADFLATALDGGPVFYDGGGQQYYALTPGSAARTWNVPDTECLGSDHFLGIPATDITAPDPRCAAYWCVPMDGPGTLCMPAAVAHLARHGRHLVAQQQSEEATARA